MSALPRPQFTPTTARCLEECGDSTSARRGPQDTRVNAPGRLLLLVLALAVASRQTAAQALHQWELLGGVQAADTSDSIWAARSLRKVGPPRTHIWMRHLLTTAAGSADIIFEFAIDCSEGTVALETKRGEMTPASKTGVEPFSGQMPVTPEEGRPSEPVPGSIEAVAFRTGCAWLKDAISAQRGPQARGMPTTDETWYPVRDAENPYDTIYVDSAGARRVARQPALISMWTRTSAHSGDSLVIDGHRAAYVMAEDHVQCGDLKVMRLATVQFLAFDPKNVLLGAADTPMHRSTRSLKERGNGPSPSSDVCMYCTSNGCSDETRSAAPVRS